MPDQTGPPRILVAVNHTIGAPQLELAVEHALRLDAEVVLLRVLSHRAGAERARAYLDTLVAQLARRGIPAEGRVVVGAAPPAPSSWSSTTCSRPRPPC